MDGWALVLVNGGAGSIGTDGVELVESDVRHRRSVERALQGADYVVHLASVAINKSVVDAKRASTST
jgi:uncharacterized protein YbjT (DUF2867 family)